MDKININLLPPEIKNRAKKEAKQSLINKISIGMLGVLILTTSVVLALVIYQGAKINLLSRDIEQEKLRIQNQRDAEAVIILLKNRIDVINQFTTKKYKQREIYNLITTLFPAGIEMDSIQIDKTNKVVITAQTFSSASLQSFFNNLTDPKVNEGKIASVTIENLNKNQLGKINFELSVHLAEGVI